MKHRPRKVRITLIPAGPMPAAFMSALIRMVREQSTKKEE